MSLLEQARSIYTRLASAPDGLTKGQLRHATGMTVSEFDRALAECQRRTAEAEKPGVVGYLPEAHVYLIARTPAQAEGIIDALMRRRDDETKTLRASLQGAYRRLYGSKGGESAGLFGEAPQTPARTPERPEKALSRTDANTTIQKVLDHLQDGGTLTPFEAQQRFGTLRLAAIVFDLRKAGYDVQSEMITAPKGKRVARYSMGQGRAVTR